MTPQSQEKSKVPFFPWVSATSIIWAGWALSPLKLKGFWHFSRLAGRLAHPDDYRIVRIGLKTQFKVWLRDPYWVRLLSRSYSYEPELLWALKHIQQTASDIVFLDCGANFGYWSLMARELFPEADVVAVEASVRNYQRLVENIELNGAQIRHINAAIYSRSGQTVLIETKAENHAGSHLSNKGTPVQTVTIDDLLEANAPRARSVIVKLDVEGVECEALAGAANAIAERDVAFLYEDHGKDRDSPTTAFVIDQLGLTVFFVDDRGGFRPVRSAEEASLLKVNPKYGYNFIAFRPDSAMLPTNS